MDLTDPIWAVTNLAAGDSVLGAWGAPTGYKISGSGGSGTARISQVSPSLVAAATRCNGSTWLKEDPSASSLTVQLEVSDQGSELFTQIIGLTDVWKRYNIPAIFTGGASGNIKLAVSVPTPTTAFAFQMSQPQLHPNSTDVFIFTATDDTEGDDAGRGAYGTNAVGHLKDAKIKEIVEYRDPIETDEGLHWVAILRDLLNRNKTVEVRIDIDAFELERRFSSISQFRRTVDNATDIKKLVEELRESGQFDIWVTEKGVFTVRQAFRPVAPGSAAPTVQTGIDFVEKPPRVKSNNKSRVTRSIVYYNFDPTASEFLGVSNDQYDDIQGKIDVVAEGPDQRATSSEFILSKWIYRAIEATALSGRVVDRYKDGAELVSSIITFQRYADLTTGEIANLQHPRIRRKSGTSAALTDNRYQAIRRIYPGAGGDLQMEWLEANFGRFGHIAPNFDLEDGAPTPFPDYDFASDAEREYAYVARNDGTVGVDNDPAYTII